MFSPTVTQFVREDVDLAPYCWLKIGGAAKYFAEVETENQLQQLYADAQKADLAVKIIGSGSNLLVQSGVVDALVVKLQGDFTAKESQADGVIVGSAALLGDVITYAAGQGLGGLEHLAGIPGTIGAAVVCNSGTANDDIGSHVRAVHGLKRDGSAVRLERDSLRFGYRRSNLEDLIVTKVELTLHPQDSEEITRRMQTNWIVKKAQQPSTDSRVAQAFIEPTGSPIADLLDASGLRTASEGDAVMLNQYPGFVTVGENATPKDVLALANRIIRAVEVQSGIRLQQQLRIW